MFSTSGIDYLSWIFQKLLGILVLNALQLRTLFVFFFKLFWIRESLQCASGVYTKFSPGIYDEFIYNHWVDATAGGDLFPLGYHQPSNQNFLC